MQIPAKFAQFIRTIFPEDGPAWLENLPHLIDRYAQEWPLVIGEPFPTLSYNFVLPVTRRDGTAAVLKAGVPHPELLTEIEALRAYNGRGAAQLIAAEPDDGIMLIERLQPGTMLHQAGLDDESATYIAAELMQKLWRPMPAAHPFPTLYQWTAALRETSASGLPKELLTPAQAIMADLLASADESVLLHGDCHHYNILLSGRQWRAIDPKGIVGDPYYEVAPFLYNPLGQQTSTETKKQLERRLDIFAETLQFDRQRLAAYGFCQCLLSAAWSAQSGSDFEYVIQYARLFDL